MRFLFVLFLCFPSTIQAQKLPEIDAQNRVIINHQDSIVYAHLLAYEKNKHVRTYDQYWYSWYAQHDIKDTRGGYEGKLLDGDYTVFYPTKELKCKGTYKKGLKSGKWKRWYKTGQFLEISNYRHGLKEGRSTLYNPDGSVASSTKYRKGILIVKKETEKKVPKNKKDKSKNADEKTKKKKKEKTPKVRARKGILIIPQPGKTI